MLRKILAAYDSSDASEDAFRFALDLAQKYEAELIVLSVARPPEPAESVETEAVLESATKFYEKHFAQLKELSAKAGVATRFEVRVGHPAEAIIHMAHEESADLIVMGHRGKSFIKRWLLGSISKRVVSYAHCAVTIVR